ncbi:MAG: DUF3159 domain-containing protein [Pseudonocardiaceae bacterium]|nr:DUF3159 domain-containing protein [Pseudonocardiaceae bacterium]
MCRRPRRAFVARADRLVRSGTLADVARTRPDPPESLTQLLGGGRSALDATLPAVAFVLGWLVSGRSLEWGAAAALTAGAGVAVMRWRGGGRPVAALLGLLGVLAAVLVALYTGRAADFFLTQLLSNLASALVWAVSILVRWPLLGLVVGGLLGQRTAWRRDPALLRAYALASWVWVGQYVVRLAVFTPLWAAGAVLPLGAARVALSWPLVAVCVAASGTVLFRALPDGHPGLRHPSPPP